MLCKGERNPSYRVRSGPSQIFCGSGLPQVTDTMRTTDFLSVNKKTGKSVWASVCPAVNPNLGPYSSSILILLVMVSYIVTPLIMVF